MNNTQLIELIHTEITNSQNHAISFARYMELALYAPGLGYYSAGARKIGAGGDFITAPELSPLFSQCIARQCKQIGGDILAPDILELGAGTGAMADEILKHYTPAHYYILEVSADLKQRQQETLKKHTNITWLTTLPKTFSGTILANEVLDALPVHRFKIVNEQILEAYVRWENDQFIWHYDQPTSPGLLEAVKKSNIQIGDTRNISSCNEARANLSSEAYKDIGEQRDEHATKLKIERQRVYESEIHLTIPPLIHTLGNMLTQGAMLFIDYGFPRHEYYHPDRHQGTLMCHYQHRAHPDPLINIGQQDITAHIDFTALAETALDAGLHVAGYTNQAAFLLGCGLMEIAAQHHSNDLKQQLKLSQQIQTLTQPHEMGELFKVMALTKNLNIDLMGFSLNDQRHRLL